MQQTASNTSELVIQTGSNFSFPKPERFEGQHFYPLKTPEGKKIKVTTGERPVQGNVLKGIRSQGKITLILTNEELDSVPVYRLS